MSRLLACLILLIALPAQADRFSTLLSVEAWGDDTIPLHGVGLLAWDTDPLWREMRLSAVYNTDTLRLGASGIRAGKLQFSMLLTAQFGLTGLLADYYQNGNGVPGRGFLANQIAFDLSAKAEIASRTYLELVMTAQRYNFGPSERDGNATDPELELPDNPLLFKPRLFYTWWNLKNDAGWRDRHRLFPRLRGLAVGAELGLDLRNHNRPWGARDPVAFEDEVDLRNTPDQVAFVAKLWLKGGWQMAPWVRSEMQGVAVWGDGQDDLNRDRLGGMNPYVVPLPGAPWASWLSSQYAADLWSWHFKANDEIELGPVLGAIVLTDPDRSNDESEIGVLWGAGLVVDWRLGREWQIDLRGGYSPSVSERADRAAWSVWIGGGWAYDDN